jgi:pyruvate/2-oxoglutarate dehydrogenase complex dihydrolipoamide dehydrogenase (E3) component
MTELLRPDICVIGAGAGGLAVAAGAAAFGVPVVLIEKGRMGGDCLNYGCVPSKALIAAGAAAHDAAAAGRFGIDAAPRIDFARTRRHVQGVIAAIAPNDSAERFAALGVRVIEGAAHFADRHTVEVAGGFAVKARRFVIATGSSPAIPNIPGLAETPHLTNETVFDLAELPSHLLVIGGGAVGLELAQAFRRLGAEVTVFEAQRLLAGEDAECAAIVADELAREGVAVRTGTTVTSVRQAAGGIEVVARRGDAQETVEATVAVSHLLVAAGRVPQTAGLGLEAAGIRHGPHGIAVDRGLKTTNRRVYAIGDAAGAGGAAGAAGGAGGAGAMFTHVANYHAGLVLRNALFRLPVKVSYNAVPRVTYTDPELAHVGLTDVQAKQQGHAFGVLRWPFRENDRAQAGRATRGHVKVVTGRGGRGPILGVTIIGRHAGELIAPWTLAIDQGLSIRAMAQVVVPYPTLGEANKRAAMSAFTRLATDARVRRVIGWLRHLG